MVRNNKKITKFDDLRRGFSQNWLNLKGLSKCNHHFSKKDRKMENFRRFCDFDIFIWPLNDPKSPNWPDPPSIFLGWPIQDFQFHKIFYLSTPWTLNCNLFFLRFFSKLIGLPNNHINNSSWEYYLTWRLSPRETILAEIFQKWILYPTTKQHQQKHNACNMQRNFLGGKKQACFRSRK